MAEEENSLEYTPTDPHGSGVENIAVEKPAGACTNILFSSGTTGEPQAIPWTNNSPLKSAADAWCHMDVHQGDVVAWPTNLGWMMGPWLVYASLINGACMALYNGSPLGPAFANDLTPAQTLDLLCSKNYLMVDIRSEKEKEKSGIPRLPSNAKNSMIAIPLEELPNKVKGIVRNSKRVEAEIAALKISYLKRINKGSNIIIMDSGWLQSRLGTDSYNFSFAQVLSPSRIIPAVSRFVTRSGTKFLP
uniref:AMP-dependent synthetase/ligase domain-containing protein n=1 Tax=Brassica oleracea var. oleracea TaxID=109376 RepID=A0A0D2ZTY6_BRAOL